MESVTGTYVFDGKINVEGFSDVSIESIALRHAIDYVEAVINADISRDDGVLAVPLGCLKD